MSSVSDILRTGCDGFSGSLLMNAEFWAFLFAAIVIEAEDAFEWDKASATSPSKVRIFLMLETPGGIWIGASTGKAPDRGGSRSSMLDGVVAACGACFGAG